MTCSRVGFTALVGAMICAGNLAVAASSAAGQCVGDCNGDDSVDIAELITGVGIALGSQPIEVCPAFDASGDGRVDIAELIAAVSNALCGCGPCPTPPPTRTRTWTATPTLAPTTTPTPSPTPRGPVTTAFEACDDDCRGALRKCGEELFFDEYDSVRDCTDECVYIVEDFASEAENYQGCVDAQVRFIECCTARGQCGRIPDGCDGEFSGAASACDGSFGGCPLTFF